MDFQKTSPGFRRAIQFVFLSFGFTALSDPNIFKSFQRLLFYTRVHFEFCFDAGIWTPDRRGLYARTPDLRASLSQLSQLHNEIVDALRQIDAGKTTRGRALIQNASSLYLPIVRSYHHRQFSDLLAILLLLQRGGQVEVMHDMRRRLQSLARSNLLRNDPRKVIFGALDDPHLPLDPTGHLYLAYDAYCRHLWFSRTGRAQVKDHFSYNQASFPRADIGGFYEIFLGKPLGLVKLDLFRIDGDLGEESHEAFSIWHTAIRSFGYEQKHEEMFELAQILCIRVDRLGLEFDYHQWRQLNLDSSLSYFLLGDAYHRISDFQNARAAFYEACRLRDIIIPAERYDSTRIAALRKLDFITQKLEGHSVASFLCGQLLDGMYSTVT
ncbi:hypothetical protein PENSTE_c013G02027 [Penicillium steckii]|uniref:Tetratricopeptide repeat protein n=1 Tax=Penicillium steckii TaxID=303698 RepID=A0A1V6T3T9_9EURO|nr:hypothetical protein PENSTE_c013G02027 [Penicillium steckii]